MFQEYSPYAPGCQRRIVAHHRGELVYCERMKIRLDKILASNGYGSRRDVKRILRRGTFTINGTVCVDASIMADPESDTFALDGETIRILTTVYLMLNKPAGVITSTDDPNHRTVMDLLTSPYSGMELFPVGRLDLDTEGLLVITNDGPLTHRLTSPKTGVDKTYYACLRDPVDDALLADYRKRFFEGIVFRDGYTCLSAKLERAGNEADGMILTIQEGKYHQVKKMFVASGNEVAYLKRISMGDLKLDPALAPGSYRELTMEEIMILRGQESRD